MTGNSTNSLEHLEEVMKVLEESTQEKFGVSYILSQDWKDSEARLPLKSNTPPGRPLGCPAVKFFKKFHYIILVLQRVPLPGHHLPPSSSPRPRGSRRQGSGNIIFTQLAWGLPLRLKDASVNLLKLPP